MVKLHDKKKFVGSSNGISTTCKLEIDFFFHKSEIIAVSCLRDAIKSKTTHSRDS